MEKQQPSAKPLDDSKEPVEQEYLPLPAIICRPLPPEVKQSLMKSLDTAGSTPFLVSLKRLFFRK